MQLGSSSYSNRRRGGGWKKWVFVLMVLVAAGAWVGYVHLKPILKKAHIARMFHNEHQANEADVGLPPDIDIPAPVPDVSATSDNEIKQAIAEAKMLEEQDDILGARDRLFKLLKDKRVVGEERQSVERLLGMLNVILTTTPRAMPGKVAYTVKEGDTLSKITSEFICPKQLIMKINKIADEDKIRPGDVLRILDHPKFEIEVSKKTNTLLVTLNGQFFKRYLVGTGEYGKTPVGTFVIDDKIEEPVWWKDGKAIPFGDDENILGTRWMNISATGNTTPVKGYGIHGTWDDSSLGKQSSAGCIRMKNSDVEEIFMLVPRGTPVKIVEN